MNHLYPTWAPESMPWLEFNLTTIGMIFLACIVASALCIWMTRGLRRDNPSKKQVIAEMFYNFIRNTVAGTLDMKLGQKFVTLAMTVFVYVFIANFLGIPLNISFSFTETTPFWENLGITQEVIAEHSSDGHGAHVAFWTSPTASPSVTISMAIAVVLFSQAMGIAHRGTKNHFKHFLQPFILFLPLHIIEEFTKVLTMGFRLYGNILAKEVLIGVILTMPFAVYYGGGFLTMAIWQGFGMFVGTLQAFVFTILTIVYISRQIVDDH